MHLRYPIFRFLKHMLPLWVSDFLLRRNIGVRISLGTTDPVAVVEEYCREIERIPRTLHDAVVMEIGYGGSFGAAVEFLNRGARHVYLYDAFAAPNDAVNHALAASSGGVINVNGGVPRPNPTLVTLLEGDPRSWTFDRGAADFVLSRAVLEHVHDVGALLDGLLGAQSLRTAVHLHFVDLRDHYFRFPYEMLCYGPWVWNHLLSPAEHLNRLRLHDYRRLFGHRFRHCETRITDCDLVAFSRMRVRIKPVFLSGDDSVDAAQRAWVTAWN